VDGKGRVCRGSKPEGVQRDPNTFYAPILVAKQKKWFEEELAAAGLGTTAIKWQSLPV